LIKTRGKVKRCRGVSKGEEPVRPKNSEPKKGWMTVLYKRAKQKKSLSPDEGGETAYKGVLGRRNLGEGEK